MTDRPSRLPGSRIPPDVWRALVVLIGVATSYLAAKQAQAPAPADPADPPRHVAEPAKPERGPAILGAPIDVDDGSAAARIVQMRADQALRDQEARIYVLEQRACALEQELREEVAERVELQAGKRGAAAGYRFREATRDWSACFMRREQVQTRASLHEAAGGALGK